jgi:hypothetical protein
MACYESETRLWSLRIVFNLFRLRVRNFKPESLGTHQDQGGNPKATG